MASRTPKLDGPRKKKKKCTNKTVSAARAALLGFPEGWEVVEYAYPRGNTRYYRSPSGVGISCFHKALRVAVTESGKGPGLKRGLGPETPEKLAKDVAGRRVFWRCPLPGCAAASSVIYEDKRHQRDRKVRHLQTGAHEAALAAALFASGHATRLQKGGAAYEAELRDGEGGCAEAERPASTAEIPDGVEAPPSADSGGAEATSALAEGGKVWAPGCTAKHPLAYEDGQRASKKLRHLRSDGPHLATSAMAEASRGRRDEDSPAASAHGLGAVAAAHPEGQCSTTTGSRTRMVGKAAQADRRAARPGARPPTGPGSPPARAPQAATRCEGAGEAAAPVVAPEGRERAAAAAAAATAAAAMAEAERTAESLVAALRRQGYGKSPEVLGLVGGPADRGVTLQGSYVRMPQLIGGRPCYQKVRRKPGGQEAAGEVVFSNVYIIWCPRGARWRIVDRPKGAPRTSYACSPLDYKRPRLHELQGNWLVRQGTRDEWVEDSLFSVVRLTVAKTEALDR